MEIGARLSDNNVKSRTRTDWLRAASKTLTIIVALARYLPR
jgi:hypothetical protein